ncbi:MAG: hypothetical protein ABJA82_13710 [Myxococcales bacterium]
MAERNLNDDARLKGNRRAVHPCHALTFDDYHDFREFLLHVRAHGAIPLELTGEDRAERRLWVAVAQIPYQDGAAAAEQTLAAIMDM